MPDQPEQLYGFTPEKTQPPTGSWAFASGETYLHCLPPTRLVNGLPVSSILKLLIIAESIELSIMSQ
jgi:hypothetical protein